MKISTRGRYALRLMLDIAQQGEGAVVSLTDIARRQDISVKYLEQIVMKLNRAGFLKSTRGVQGGYMLLRRPEEYSVGGYSPGHRGQPGPHLLPDGGEQPLQPLPQLRHPLVLGEDG